MIMETKYFTPNRRDIAVCMCFFSPAGFKKPKENFKHVFKLLTNARIPTFTIECVIGNQVPVIENPTVQVRSDSCLFYKEQLYNLLVPKIPEQYTKLIFIDSDIIFNNKKWVDVISEALDTHDVVQPFETAILMSPYYGTYITIKKSLFFGLTQNLNVTDGNLYHHGFSFAMTRDYYNKIGGFFDKCIIGAGDSAFSCLFFRYKFDIHLSNFIKREHTEWFNKASAIPKRFTYLPMTIYHMYHGNYSDRKYNNRHDLLNNIESWDDFAYTNKYGVYELENVEYKKIMKGYFLSRKEDDFPSTNFSRVHK